MKMNYDGPDSWRSGRNELDKKRNKTYFMAIWSMKKRVQEGEFLNLYD